MLRAFNSIYQIFIYIASWNVVIWRRVSHMRLHVRYLHQTHMSSCLGKYSNINKIHTHFTHSKQFCQNAKKWIQCTQYLLPASELKLECLACIIRCRLNQFNFMTAFFVQPLWKFQHCSWLFSSFSMQIPNCFKFDY